ncbi:hypothetical protein FC89_GL000450 [Liquorilactobacillus ghanensis DSM 18630]|uniref:Sensor histidine kinase NatK-like C-terminal domain-containing protein n=1 Tax=Liquorilactobacillus ghanensis DSM 18630 TaxID=1423750 RepID=A0A0R1VMV8_9LACO|nr:sensor histidine kinase [Liquorilactobacillus ghanensis]KRM07134.1 hypothetical protein FC89_GL000450 [Liquorilactobacillus ghanensis DSM 18630]
MSTILPNIPRAFTGFAEVLAVFLMIIQLPTSKRKDLWAIKLILLSIGQIFFQLLAGKLPLWMWIPGMLLNICYMFFTLRLIEKVPFQISFYHLCKAFILAEFWASITWQLFCWLILPFTKLRTIETFFVVTSYVFLFLFFYRMEKRPNYRYSLNNVSLRDSYSAAITAAIIFFISNLGFILNGTFFNLGDSLTIFILRTSIDICGVLLLSLQENQRYEIFLNQDLTEMNNMFQSQYEQYQTFRENTELVNQRFHDLKHQLAIISLEENIDKRIKYAHQIEKDIQQYKAYVKTGNPIADVILTHKNFQCIKNKITFTCIANGKLLNRIDTMDLCSLLGNALDNAIESSLQLVEEEKRLINVRLNKQSGFIIFCVENYTENIIQTTEGLPHSTKKNSKNHGYGLRSINYIAQKYNGKMIINLKENWFTLKVLLPLKE